MILRHQVMVASQSKVNASKVTINTQSLKNERYNNVCKAAVAKCVPLKKRYSH